MTAGSIKAQRQDQLYTGLRFFFLSHKTVAYFESAPTLGGNI